MKKHFTLIAIICCNAFFANVLAQDAPVLSDDIAMKLSRLPLHCISQEYPNKTGHIINHAGEVPLSPRQLHPAFYGCFDWHSSVHGHWMLIRLLRTKPQLANREEIIQALNATLTKENIETEAAYFTKYELANHFERTYGWAWILKLDEELTAWDHPLAREWHENLRPLTEKIVSMWEDYLPKQTYPNRTGVHPNSAFALAFAIDWARATGHSDFEKKLIEKSVYFYGNDTQTPAHLEPDGADFFSPSLQIADLMRRILSREEFTVWFNAFYTPEGLNNVSQIPVVSDLNDFQTVHLVGLSFSRAWCMKGIAAALPDSHPEKQHLIQTAEKLLHNALPLVFEGNYGGDHWLASFAIMALD